MRYSRKKLLQSLITIRKKMFLIFVVLAVLAAGSALDESNEMIDFVDDICGGPYWMSSLQISGCRNGICVWNAGDTVTLSYLYENVPSMKSVNNSVNLQFMGQIFAMEAVGDTTCVGQVCPLEQDVIENNQRYNVKFELGDFIPYGATAVYATTTYRPYYSNGVASLTCIKFVASAV